MRLPIKQFSYWKTAYPTSLYPAISSDIEVDVVIVGGGITGLTSAYLLKQSGLSVAVLEKHVIGNETTSGTTGKVTSQHGIVYADLIKKIGEAHTRLYAEANQAAIEKMESVIRSQNIDCGWRRLDNYVFTTDPQKVEQFKSEATTAARLGLPATFETKLQLPFEVLGAVKFANQATFNAQKYVAGLASAVHGGGSYVFENSNVISIRDGEPATVRTNTATVTAKNIIVATKVPAFPLIARFSYALFEYPHTSYIVAAKFKNDLKGMYISPDKDHYSILPVNDDEQLLLIGGGKHIPGLGRPEKRHQMLAKYAEEHFGITDIKYRWKAMDYLAYDSVPLIGKVYPWSKHLYTATGFKKWGLSTSMVASTILHDLILGIENPWAPVFRPSRIRAVLSMPRAIAEYVSSKV